jgi:addiction module RelE/StbE family toxin
MINLIWDSGFKKRYRKIIKNNDYLKTKFHERLDLFCKDPFDSKLKTHKLSGNLKDLWAISITYDCRLIFSFCSDDTVLLIDIGGHDEVY